MDKYNNYIEKLKNYAPEADFSKRQTAIEQKVATKSFLSFSKLALVTGLASILILISVFSYSGQFNYNNEDPVSWVLSQDSNNNDDILLSYILND
ncbi:hypothetical protein A2291_01055 [candidate division WOR-1 bacterium RIFOXYB2_FULL_42_35]|uniref:Uncharacterized protein n=1 Tax=candidate division WOR-1 bacterium RIFOXYC2_FULL_41_25 TaxID=1802586 RepID=A0A1F4TN41_UNCSA|nr:MAG: hypothetical protein A2247_02690 [candidate division WOR-1 bacterium RIFOXYA2_FULL_41_14]OGC23025.1 MAG: hypothetical protein A2291_01055 [candidate division WOR-1 bacterium RIFOXYB2_FULL_42_35]OGC33483.1 MAG: hypothetical protein A2462_06835 [candidate division WOR-1 bacterium RIFOXYC2_FULL_41_25]OGC43640.1 MAG: hypothetical protein A2548_04345 [candidate division WOR-1 bacterium RIFOXYD2_FULL_41_8]